MHKSLRALDETRRKAFVSALTTLLARIEGNLPVLRYAGICYNLEWFHHSNVDVPCHIIVEEMARDWPERTKKSGAHHFPVGGRDAYRRDLFKGTQWEGKQGAKRHRLLKWLIEQSK